MDRAWRKTGSRAPLRVSQRFKTATAGRVRVCVSMIFARTGKVGTSRLRCRHLTRNRSGTREIPAVASSVRRAASGDASTGRVDGRADAPESSRPGRPRRSRGRVVVVGGRPGKSASAASPTRPRRRVDVAFDFSRATASLSARGRGDGGRDTNRGRGHRRARGECERVDRSLAPSRASRRPARSRTRARAACGRDSLSRASRKDSKKPRRRRVAHPRVDAALRRAGRGAAHRGSARTHPFDRTLATPARPRGRVTGFACLRRQTAPSATARRTWRFRGEATRRVSSRAMRRGRTRGRLRAVPSGRKQPRRERRATRGRGTTARAFVRRSVFQNRRCFAGKIFRAS